MATRRLGALAGATMFLCLATNVFAQQASEKSVRELMALTGAGNLGAQVMQSLLPALKQMDPRLPASFWDDFMKEVNPDELVDMVVPIYQQNFNEEDIQAAIKSYQSPSGQKLIRQTPVVMQQSVAAGQKWGQIVAQRAAEKAKAQQAQSAK